MAARAALTEAELEAQAAEAEAKLAVIRQAREEERRETQARRQAALEEWDRGWLADWDDSALEAEERAARHAFVLAVAEDPVFSAWARFRGVRRLRQVRAGEAENIATRLGVRRTIRVPGMGEEDVVRALLDAMEQLALIAAEDDTDARAAERDAAGEAAADSPGVNGR